MLPIVSHDGRWIAYASKASGQFEVFVGSQAAGVTPRPVSAGGGLHPIWRGDGRELFYLGPNDEILAVSITVAEGQMVLGEPTRLFRIPLNDNTRTFTSPYDVAPDGQRFLLNVPEAPSSLLYVQRIDRLIAAVTSRESDFLHR